MSQLPAAHRGAGQQEGLAKAEPGALWLLPPELVLLVRRPSSSTETEAARPGGSWVLTQEEEEDAVSENRWHARELAFPIWHS